MDISDLVLSTELTEIDNKLRAENDRIVGRELRGWFAFCQRHSLSMPMDSPLAGRVFAWFKELYGDRLNIDWDFGQTAVDIQGDLYRIRCVAFYGTMYAICASAFMGKKGQHRAANGAVRSVINLLDRIEDLTPELARRLTPAACSGILNAYGRSFLAFSRMMAKVDAVHIKEAIDDLTISGEMLLSRCPNYGQSNWASLQAVEKTLKSFIVSRGGEPKFKHDLSVLGSHATSLGLPRLNRALLDQIQCSPAVRYDSSLVTKGHAAAAHYAALALCGEITPLIKLDIVEQGSKKVLAYSDVGRATIRVMRDLMLEGLILVYAPARFDK